MRVVRVSLFNLNSLRGQHEVDFSAEPIASSGIFAITGPTGAGKSTLLDAITLALYGRAARYSNEANPQHMMSRHTGECGAEVEFQVPEGTFRATWQLRRSRGNPGGNIQPARRYLYDSAGVVLADKVRDVETKVEELSGLDYERFMRSVLLAQGEFAKFLKARPGERAGLLESLTGTHIYSELGKLAHEEAARREADLAVQETAIGQIQELEKEAREKLEAEVKGSEEKLKAARVRRSKYEKEVGKAIRLREAVEASAQVRAQLEKLKLERNQAQPGLAALKLHNRVAPIVPLLDRVIEQESAIQQLADALEKTSKQIETTEGQLRTVTADAAVFAASELAKVEEKRDAARRSIAAHTKQKVDAEDWLREHAIDESLSRNLTEISKVGTKWEQGRLVVEDLRKKLANLRDEESAAKARATRAGEELVSVEKETRKLTEQLEKKKAFLGQLLAGRTEADWREQLKSLLKRKSFLAEVRLLHEARDKADRMSQEAKKKIETAETALKSAEESAARLRKEWKSATELLESHRAHLETAKLAANLETHRAKLKDGEPCPLCGSADHPYADKAGDGIEAVRKVEVLVGQSDNKVKKIEETGSQARESVVQSKAELKAAESEWSGAKEELKSLAQKLDALSKQGEIGESNQQEITDLDRQLEELEANIVQIEKAQGAVKEAETRLAQVSKTAEQIRGESKSSSVLLEKLQSDVKKLDSEMLEKVGAMQSETKAFDTLLKPLGLGFLDSNEDDLRPEAEWLDKLNQRNREYELKLKEKAEAEKQVTLAQTNEKHAGELVEETLAWRDALNLDKQAAASMIDNPEWKSRKDVERSIVLLKDELKGLQVSSSEWKRQAGVVSGRLEELNARLESGAREAGFANAVEVRRARLADDEAAALQELEQGLTKRHQSLSAQSEVHEKKAEALRSEGVAEGAEFARIKDLKIRSEKEADELSETCAAHRESLATDDRNRIRLKELGEQLAGERKRLETWRQLKGLIGSADGSKFSRYAQGVSLDILVGHANRHLARLNDRYMIRRLAGVELELEIVDGYQGGTTRPMTSLSGGESFLVSLALALGLSDLAGRNVRIDSLFIDEGFGALDAETLDVAISALDSLRLDQKTVGVISHIDLLKERIATQVVVSKGADGVGNLSVVAS